VFSCELRSKINTYTFLEIKQCFKLETVYKSAGSAMNAAVVEKKKSEELKFSP